MPVEDPIVSQVIENDRRVGLFIIGWQNDTVRRADYIQSYTRRQAMSRVPREVKAGLKAVNDDHLRKIRTGYFDSIFMAGARSVDPTYIKTPQDTAKVQRASMDYYVKMRNARQFASKDSERFISHLWEDTPKRRAMVGRTTNYLERFEFMGRGRDMIEDPMGLARMDKRFGVKAAIGADGRKYNYTSYSRMQGDAFTNRLYNDGALSAAEKLRRTGKNVVIVVSDGPDCGWTYHDDPEKANGMRVSIEEARANPIAHPHCVRRFSVSNKKKDKDDVSKRAAEAKIAKKIITGAIVGGLSAYSLSAVANVAASSVSRFAASKLYEDWINHLRELMFNGDVAAMHFLRAAVRFQDRLIALDPGVLAARLRAADAQLLPFVNKAKTLWPGGPDVTDISEAWQGLRAVGEDFIQHGREIPEDVARFLSRIAPGHRTEEQFQLAFEGMQKVARSQTVRANLRSVTNAEFQRRDVLHRLLLRIPGAEQYASRIQLTWTKWGTRLRLDNLDWLRTHLTFTPGGIIKSMSFFPKAAYRGVVKMYADGSIGGHISALPKNFMNGIFRAIVEVDQAGALVGNIRLVPKGPLRFTLEFITRQPKEVAENLANQFGEWLVLNRGDVIHNYSARMIANELVDFLKGHPAPLGFRTTDLANAVARHLKEESLVTEPLARELARAIEAVGAKLTFDPRDIYGAAKTFGAARVVRDLGYAVRQFKFSKAVVEWRIFNKSILDISGSLRIPIQFVKRAVQDLALQGVLSETGVNTWSGLFRYSITNLNEVFQTLRMTSKHMVDEGLAGVRSTIFGNIRFSGLVAQETNKFLNALRTGNVRFLSRFHFDQDGLRDIATNMKIFGWNVYDIANVLKLRVQDVKAAIDEGLARVHLMAYRLGITNLDDAYPKWDAIVEHVRVMLGSRVDRLRGEVGGVGGGPETRANAIFRVVKAMGQELTNPADEKALRYMAGIKPGDSVDQIHLKLLHLRNWIRTTEARKEIVWRDWHSQGPLNPFGFVGLPPGVSPETLPIYRNIGDYTEQLTYESLKQKALEIAGKGKVIPLFKEQALSLAEVRQYGIDSLNQLQFLKEKFFSHFRENGWLLNDIQNAWDRTVLQWDMATRKFIPTGFRATGVPDDVRRAAADWRTVAVDDGPTSFTVGDVRFTVDDAVGDALIGDGKSLLAFVDDKVVEEVMTDTWYLRRRFPNVPLPEFKFVFEGNPGQFYYKDGIIHINWAYADNFEKARGQLWALQANDSTSFIRVPQYRRNDIESGFRRIIFHEYGHYLTDYLSDEQVDRLVHRIAERTDISMPGPARIAETLTAWQKQLPQARVVDLLGSPFAGWRRLAQLQSDIRSTNSFMELRPASRNIGWYGTQNVSEMIAESLSHYLEFRDPALLPRIIGSFFDQELLGADAERVVRFARPQWARVLR